MLGSAKRFGRINITGLIHVGAHSAEELCLYHKHRIKDILWVEANDNHKDTLLSNIRSHPGSRAAFFAAGETEGTVTLHLPTRHTLCASLLPPTESYKGAMERCGGKQDIVKKTVPQKRLDNFVRRLGSKVSYNALVLDTQGYELVVLKGATGLLPYIDMIITEYSESPLYEGQALREDLDKFLDAHGFARVQKLRTHSSTHGDALYIKKQFADTWPT